MWLRYVDASSVNNRHGNLDTLLQKLNDVNPELQFTIERQVDQTLAFFDTILSRRKQGKLLFVSRKQKIKNDFTNYLST